MVDILEAKKHQEISKAGASNLCRHHSKKLYKEAVSMFLPDVTTAGRAEQVVYRSDALNVQSRQADVLFQAKVVWRRRHFFNIAVHYSLRAEKQNRGRKAGNKGNGSCEVAGRLMSHYVVPLSYH